MGFLRTDCLILVPLALAGALFGQAPPDAADQTRVVAAMRAAALDYDKNLPNFICIQTTHREIRWEPDLALGVRSSGRGSSQPVITSSSRSGQWEKIDSYEEQLSYFDHHENYLLTKMNGKPASKKASPPPGLASSGEFGSTLLHVFEKESKADFQWVRYDTLRGHPVQVFSFRIAKENSVAQLTAGTEQVVVAYHGFVFADRETNTILRLTTEADTPREFPLQNVTHVLDYGEATIVGEKFLLPLHSEMETRASEDFMKNGRVGTSGKQATMRNIVDFSAFRKYSAESSLKPE